MVDTVGHNPTVKLASGLNILLGIWLIAAPWVLGYSGEPAMWNESLVGIAVIVVAAIKLASPIRLAKISWVNVALGVWLIIAPFVLHPGTPLGAVEGVSPALWNDIVVGIFIVVLSYLSAGMVTTREKPGRSSR
ncbi:SPW repeat protein [Proteobacteria bacterium 005FR1]|nr:SPW repeat protein [Proteobacteria bacterium 005FR1]